VGRVALSLRFVLGAVLVLELAALLYVYLVPARPLPGHFQNAGYSEYRPGGSRCDPARLATLKERQALVERDRCQEAAEEYRLKSDDLTQQTRSADATEAIVELTYNQSRMMAVGTAIGFLTFIAAMFAVLYARSAAVEARRGASADEGQLRLARQVTEAELRPYLFIDRVEVEPDARENYTTYKLKIFYKNYGKLPARMVRVRCDAYFTDDLSELRKNVFRARIISIPVVAPGHERRTFANVLVPKTNMEKLIAGDGQIILRVRFSYRGEGKLRLREEADYIYDRQSIETGHFYILSEAARKRRHTSNLEMLEWMKRREGAARDMGHDEGEGED
jgi:hypothetical protein